MCDTNSCGSDPKGIPTILKVSGEQRRAFLRGLVSLPLAAVLADPRLAHAAGEGLEHVSVTTPSGGRYDEEDAALSWARTLSFFRHHLG